MSASTDCGVHADNENASLAHTWTDALIILKNNSPDGAVGRLDKTRVRKDVESDPPPHEPQSGTRLFSPQTVQKFTYQSFRSPTNSPLPCGYRRTANTGISLRRNRRGVRCAKCPVRNSIPQSHHKHVNKGQTGHKRSSTFLPPVFPVSPIPHHVTSPLSMPNSSLVAPQRRIGQPSYRRLLFVEFPDPFRL